jgi:hypothetical protein
MACRETVSVRLSVDRSVKFPHNLVIFHITPYLTMKVKPRMARDLSSVLVVLLLVIPGVRGVAQAPPSADTYVTSAMPASNFGASQILPVQPGTTSFVRLNLGALPANAKIAKATLRLYVDAVSTPGSFDVFAVAGNWNEQGLRFNNTPPLGASATEGQPISLTKTSVNQFILIDITALAQGWLNGSVPNQGVALTLTSADGSFAFDSKESVGTGHQPELEVVLEGPAGLPGATFGTSTVAGSMQQGSQPPGPDPYVDNGTAVQVGASFNIDGNGTAATLNATSLYQLGGSPVLGSNGGQSLFVGTQAGQNNTGNENTFLGIASGQANTSGNFNTFVGKGAGASNTTGAFNTFIGRDAGQSNTTGTFNSFLGTTAGSSNTTGSYNFFLGGNAGYSNTTGAFNVFVGTGAGGQNTTGQSNTMFGNTSGQVNTTGSYNAFFGGSSGAANTTGSANIFFGPNAGYSNTTGSNNLYVGVNSGVNADPAANNNLYIGSQGAPGENGAIRIGDPTNQTAAYIAGINGATTTSGVPVFVDSKGKLGTGGGTVSFSQVTGILASPQFAGTYSNSVTLANTNNVFDGTFSGNGSGLTGVASGLSWPVISKSADYTLQTSDFSTPSRYGNYLILAGSVAHTFTLPNPAPPNGDCVAIGNNASAPIGSNTNVFLTVSANGLTVDGGAPNATQPKRNSYLYCSDGANYWRLNRQLASPSQIGPVLYTVDTGTVNALQTTFVAGLDFGLNTGTTIFLLPVHANTTSTPTLNVNGLGAKRILRYGNQGLAPGDLSIAALAVLIYDGQFWQLVNPQTAIGTVTSVAAISPLVSTGGNTPTISITGLAGGVLAGSAPAFTANPVLGVPGSSLGTLSFAGNASGAITMKPQAAAGTWEWDWPNTAGSPGQVLTSQGGAGSPMTWSTITTNGLADPGSNGLVFRNAPQTTQAITGNANQVLVAGPTPSYIDFPDVKYFAAASCNAGTPSAIWSLGAAGTVACRGGINNGGGFVTIGTSASTFAQVQVEIPADWDTTKFPYVRFHLASTDGTSGHTIIPQVAIACMTGSGATSDDPAFQVAHTASTITLNGTANSFWNTSALQLNTTDLLNCVGGSSMIVQIGRAGDTATNAEFYGATVTFPRLLTVQAN